MSRNPLQLQLLSCTDMAEIKKFVLKDGRVLVGQIVATGGNTGEELFWINVIVNYDQWKENLEIQQDVKQQRLLITDIESISEV